MEVEMQVAGQDLQYDIHEQLFFDIETVFGELGTHPGQLSWWYSLLAFKDEELNNFKVSMEGRISQIELEFRGNQTGLVAAYGKVTESVITAAVNCHTEVLELRQKLNELTREAALLKAMTRGMESRTSLMATASSAQKAEVEARLRATIKQTQKASK